MTAPTDTTPAPWDEARLAEHEETLRGWLDEGVPGPWVDALECVAALRDALGADDPQIAATRDEFESNTFAVRRDDYGPGPEYPLTFIEPAVTGCVCDESPGLSAAVDLTARRRAHTAVAKCVGCGGSVGSVTITPVAVTGS